MNITIRAETERDHRAVEELTREAFWNLYVPGCDEHYLVHKMRAHPDFISELDFVAEVDGRLVGNIMYTKASLIDETGRELSLVCFGPISVLPQYQRRGIGSALIRHTADIVKAKGFPGIGIFGDPHDYCKHGFKNGRDFNISDMNGQYPQGLLVLQLQDKAFAGHQWKFRCSDVYNLNAEEAEAFDRGFPSKEKGHRYSQDIFSIAVRSYLK